MRGVTSNKKGGVNNQPGGSKSAGCQYTKKGVCKTHGEGAKLHWRGSYVKATRPDGTHYKKYAKEYYYECDLNLMGDRKLKQAKLPLIMMTQNGRGGGGDDSFENGKLEVSSSKEGQNINNCDDEVAGRS